MAIDLRTIDWGTGEAKTEISQFRGEYRDIFIDIDDRKMINEKNHLILWGRRGCGKTAMAWKLSNVDFNNDREAIKIDFEDSDEWVEALLEKSGIMRDAIGFPFRKSYSELWYTSILIEMMWVALEKNFVEGADRRKLRKILRECDDIDRKHGVIYTLLDRIDHLFRMMETTETVNPYTLTAKSIATIMDHLSGSVDFLDAVAVLSECLQSNPNFKIRIIVDSVDKWMLSPKFKDESKQDFFLLSLVVRSLVRSLIKINDDPLFKNSVEIKAFLPMDLRPFMEDRAAVHEDMHHHTMHWHGTELAALIAKRISRSNKLIDGVNNYVDNLGAWDKIFPFQITNSVTNVKHKPFDYLLRHSQFRPREILFCCQKMSEHARLLDKPTLNEIEFKDVIHAHCTKEATRIIEEFTVLFPNIHNVLSKFIKSSNILEAKEIYTLLKSSTLPDFLTDTRELIQFLYEIGFIGIMMDEYEKNELGKVLPHTRIMPEISLPYSKVKAKTYYFCFKFLDPSRKVLNSNVFVIHPIFYGKLAIQSDERITISHYACTDVDGLKLI